MVTYNDCRHVWNIESNWGLISFIMVTRYTTIHKGWDKQITNQLLVFTINGIIIMLLPLRTYHTRKVTTYDNIAFLVQQQNTIRFVPNTGCNCNSFYPRLFAFGNENNTVEHRKLSYFELKLMSFLGIGISIPFIADPSFWIINLLGEKYEPAGEALAILAFMVIIQSINYPLADNLTTIGKQWKRTITMSLGLCVAIVSYILLGSYLGMMGQQWPQL